MVRKANQQDLPALAGLGARLWPGHTPQQLAAEFAGTMSGADACFFLKLEGETPVGFAQCQLRRDYVEGTQTTPVGYLEGIFVCAGYRRRGYARELLAACEGWARAAGCREFASDCELDNLDSFRFHRAAGFAEANRIICFAKEL